MLTALKVPDVWRHISKFAFAAVPCIAQYWVPLMPNLTSPPSGLPLMSVRRALFTPFRTKQPCSMVAEPATVKPPVVVTLATESWVVASMVVPPAAAMACITSCPPTYSGPPMSALEPHTMLPEQSKEGVITWRKNSAEVSESPSCSTPAALARRSCWPAAGSSSEQVSSDSCSELEEVSVACFCASAAVSPVTSAMATGPEDDCAEPSACRIFVDPTISCPSMVQLPLALSAPLTNAPVEALSDRTVVVPHP